MVLGLLTATAACPAIVGVNETVMHGQRQNAKNKHRGRKMNLAVSCTDPSKKSRDVNGSYIVLRNHKVTLFSLAYSGERMCANLILLSALRFHNEG